MSPKMDHIFARYAQGLILKDPGTALAKRRAEKIVDALRQLGWVIDAHEMAGSTFRGTAIQPLHGNNVDLFVVVNGRRYVHLQNPEGVHHIMRVFYEHLHYAFPKVPIQQTPHEIRLDFPEFRMDVTPAMRWHTGCYLIPDTGGGTWRHTDPASFSKRIHEMNATHDGVFLPLIHMIKAWNQREGSPLEGFHIECMAVRRYNGTGRLGSVIQALPTAMSDFFLALPSMLRLPSVDPHYNQRVDTYLGGLRSVKREKAQERAELAAGHAGAAYDLAHTGHTLQALAHWAELFGQELIIPLRTPQR